MEELTWTERREASFVNVLEASWPQAPNDSTTRGMQLQPSSSQIPEFACIFRCSVAFLLLLLFNSSDYKQNIHK